jgi:hypothetical protein
MGENQAQQAFQHNVNAGIRMGSSAQGFARAEDARNQARLGYQSQAGQQELGIQQALALEQQRRNDEQLKKYGLDISQRGQNLDYMSNLMRMMSGGGGGGGMKMGGTSSGHTTFTPGVSLLDTQNRDFAGMNQGGNDYSGYHNFGSSQPAYQPPVYGYSSGGGGSSNQFYSGMGGNQVQESGGRVSTYY